MPRTEANYLNSYTLVAQSEIDLDDHQPGKSLGKFVRIASCVAVFVVFAADLLVTIFELAWK